MLIIIITLLDTHEYIFFVVENINYSKYYVYDSFNHKYFLLLYIRTVRIDKSLILT